MPREVLDPRTRSRSPYRLSHGHHERHLYSRDRSRSPRRTHRRHHSHHVQKPSASPLPPAKLPFEARSLSRHDLAAYKPMFALYLDIQKNIIIEDLAEDEVKGRWKSFMGKWNDGKLAEGWYDPQTLMKAISANTATGRGGSNAASSRRPKHNTVQTGQSSDGQPHDIGQDEEQGDNDDEEFGPTLPESNLELSIATSSNWPGPSIPRLQDLQYARELAAEDALASHKQASKDLYADRKSEQAVRKSHFDEIAPRAEPGTRERQLEKRRELAASNRAFASAKTDPADVEVPEADVMGGEEGLGELKRLKEIEERKRSEREIRREEVMRAKREEREGRVREIKEKEEKTMEMLREIARVRFGAGTGGGSTEAAGRGG